MAELLSVTPKELDTTPEFDMDDTPREETMFQGDDDDIVPVSDSTAAKELMKDSVVEISEKVNLDSRLLPYLVQSECILQEEMSELREGPKSSDNNMKLIEIIGKRGVTGLNNFMRGLKKFTKAHPEDGAHIELLDSLQIGTMRLRYKRRRPTGSSLHSQESQTSVKSDPRTSISTVQKSRSIPEEKETVDKGQVVDKDIAQPQPSTPTETDKTDSSPAGDLKEDSGSSGATNKSDPKGQKTTSKPNTKGIEVPQFTYFVWVSAVVTCICSPVCFIGGLVILIFSVIAFGNEEDCSEVGASHSLSVFNFIFSLLSLSIPGLLVMLTIYFCCERYFEEKWEKKFLHKFTTKRFVIWLIVLFFLVIFILTVVELLYSLAYVASEVYNNYGEWKNNRTICAEAVYVTSFTVLTFSGAVVFILLTVLGVFVALLFFRWVTDPVHPGALKELMLAYLPRNKPVDASPS